MGAEGVTITKADPVEIQLSEKPVPTYTVVAQTYRAEVFDDGRVRVLAGGRFRLMA